MKQMFIQSLRFFWRAFHGIFIALPFRYWRTLLYIAKSRGIKGLYNFIFVKLFARGERVGLQLLDPVEMNFPQLTPYPYMIEVEITTRCHLRCTICEHTYWTSEEYKKQDLSFELFKYILDQFPKLKYINLTGEGSSFLNKDFVKMLELVRERNIYATVVESFTNIKENELEALVKNTIGKVVLSLDGATKETYDKIRVGADFDKVVENVKKFRALREKYNSPLPEFVFRFIFFKDNYQELVDYPDLINELRIKKTADGFDNHVELTALLEFEEIKDWIYEPNEEIIRITNEKLNKYKLKHAWSHPSHDPEKKRPVRECTAWAEPYIMMGGYVIPCCSVLMSNKRDFLEKHSFGNIYETPYKDIWNSKRYREFRKLVPRSTGEIPIFCEGCRGFETTRREKESGISKTI